MKLTKLKLLKHRIKYRNWWTCYRCLQGPVRPYYISENADCIRSGPWKFQGQNITTFCPYCCTKDVYTTPSQ